jgi:hypothetical protein
MDVPIGADAPVNGPVIANLMSAPDTTGKAATIDAESSARERVFINGTPQSSEFVKITSLSDIRRPSRII